MHERFQEISRNENITIDELEEVFSMGAQVSELLKEPLDGTYLLKHVKNYFLTIKDKYRLE